MTTRDYDCIRLTIDGPKAFLTLHRPEVLNALNTQLVEEALHAVVHLPADIRVLVLRGAGDKAFCAGADLVEMQRRTIWSDMPFGPRRELAQRLERAPFPTVAAINGVALGGGFELALACHLRIASETAKVGLPEIRLGIVPGNGGATRLARLVGQGRALQHVLLGDQIDARRAEQYGVVNWVVPAADFDAEVQALADRLARLPPVSARAVIDAVVRGGDMGRDDAIAYEHRWFQICLASPDKQEGVAAFLEKRRADFRGV